MFMPPVDLFCPNFGCQHTVLPSLKDPQDHRLAYQKGPWTSFSSVSSFHKQIDGDDEAQRREMTHQGHQGARAAQAQNPALPDPGPTPSLPPSSNDWPQTYLQWQQPYSVLAPYALPVLILSSLGIEVMHLGKWTLRIYHLLNCGSKTPQSPDLNYIRDEPTCWLTDTGWPSTCPLGTNSNWQKKLNCPFLLLLNFLKAWNSQREAR